MPSGTHTPKLDLLRIQELWQFGDAAFNRFIDDADDKLVGVAHLQSPMHWTEWKPETVYVKGDVVRYPNLKSHQYAACLVGGTSDVADNIPENNITGSIIDDNTVKWEVCSLTESDPNGGTIRIWLAGTYYRRGDAVRYGDALYRAKVDHQASNNFGDDENWWQEIYASIRFWKPNIYYYLDDTAIYDNNIYKCIRAHKSVANFESDDSATPAIVGDDVDWEIICDAGGAKDWTTSTKYQYGQLVLVNGILYRCNTKHTSTTFSADIANWDLVKAQIKDWVTGEYYVAGTLVAYNNIIYKCLTNHTASAAFTTDIANWTLYHNHIGIWERNKSYYQGQIVIYVGVDERIPIGGGGERWYHDFRLYRCNTTHVSSNTITDNGVTRDATFFDDISKWDALNASPAMWRPNTAYKFADIVEFRNELYKCCKEHISNSDMDIGIFGDITDNVSTNCWYLIRVRNSYVQNWQANKFYDVNQLVMYGGTLYRCNVAHTSTSTFDPTKWDLVYANIQPWATGIAYKQNSMVLHDNKLYICTNAHTSTTFNSDIANWLVISGEAGIADWITGKAYAKDAVVLYNGILYRNNVVHTSASTFANDATYWDIVYASIPTWTTNVYYPVNMIVSYNNLVYKCVTAHTSSTFSSDISKWILYNYSILNWSASTFYPLGQIVLYDNVLYKCNINHTSASTFDVTKWDLVYANIRTYANNTVYKVGSNVIYDNKLYRCNTSHTSNTDDIKKYISYINSLLLNIHINYPMPYSVTVDLGNITVIKRITYNMPTNGYVSNADIMTSIDGSTFTLLQNIQTSDYSVDFVCNVQARYIKFVCKHAVNHSGSGVSAVRVTDFSVYTDNSYWTLIGDMFTVINDWESNTSYNTNEVVKYQAGIYRCLQTNKDSTWDKNKWEQIGGTIATKAQIDALFI